MIQRVIKATFGILGTVSPKLGGHLAFKLFFKPFRVKLRPEEQKLKDEATEFQLSASGKKVFVYEWGDGPVVIFAHGWSSKGLHFRKFVHPLVDKGYKVIIPDFPGHVKSEGESSNVLEFKDILIQLFKRFGSVEAIVTHSLGGLAATLTLIETDVPVKKWIMFNSATYSSTIMKRFKEQVGANHRIEKVLRKLLKQRFHSDFDYYSIFYRIDEIKNLPEMYVVSDKNDPDAPYAEGKELADKIGCSFMLTEGLGHNKAIRDEEVVGKMVSFITKKPGN